MGATISQLSTHVLDAVAGKPASGVRVRLLDSAGNEIGSGCTDSDGRIAALGPGTLAPATYRLVFATGDYFASQGVATFYPEVVVTFTASGAYLHVPLLLSPFAYSTYRGS